MFVNMDYEDHSFCLLLGWVTVYISKGFNTLRWKFLTLTKGG